MIFYLGAAVAALAIPVGGLAVAIMYKGYFEAIGRNPEAQSKVPFSTLILGTTFVELPIIFSFVISLLLINAETDALERTNSLPQVEVVQKQPSK